MSNQKAFDYSNVVMLKMRKLLIERGIDAANVQETLGTITDGVGEYLYPTDMWLPKEMEINWWNPTAATNVANSNYVPVDKVADTNLATGSSIGKLRQMQSFNNPLVDYRGDYYEIFPTPLYTTWGGTANGTLASAIRFFYYLQPTLYTDNVNLTDTLSFPESLDYHSFAKCIAAYHNYTISKLTNEEMESIIKYEVERLVQMLQGAGKSPTKSAPVPLSGWEY